MPVPVAHDTRAEAGAHHQEKETSDQNERQQHSHLR
jgi:hypothetical protein